MIANGVDKNQSHLANFEVIKSVEKLINFTDNASEGTNRMSGSCVKLNKASKMSEHPLMVSGNSPTFKDSAVTFENNERRSVEIKKL